MRPTNRTTWIILASLLGLAGLHGPGCSDEEENSARNGEDPALKGQCTPAVEDGDPCTLEGCEGQANAHVVVAGRPCGLNGSLTCTATGDCGGCATPDECVGDPINDMSGPCVPWACDLDKICRLTPRPNGEPLQTQIPNDCKEVQCDGAGGEKTVNDNGDVPTIDCLITTCVNGAPVSTPAAQGKPCTAGGGKSCDGKGKCVECNTDDNCGPVGIFCDPKSNTCFTCTDNKKNGDESDIDCGGIRCARCTQGEGCAIAGDCTTNFCADGTCCNTTCDAACEACDLPSSVGTCDFIERYGQDQSYGAGMSCLAADMKACTGAGGCKGALGVPCTGPTDCASGKCSTAGKICVKTTGDKCNLPSECFSNTCTNGVCG